MSAPTISICILNWNRKDDIIQSINFIKESTYQDFEIILVDNNSSDGTSQAIRDSFPEVVVIDNDKNNGIEGWNVAFEKAQGKYLLALDNDAHPEKTALEKIVTAFETNPTVGIIACNILTFNDKKSAFNYVKENNNEPIEQYDFIGCGVVIRKEVIEKIGGFANFLFMYAHETEYSLRALESGYRLMLFPDIVVFHRVSSVSRSSGMSIEYCTRNFLIIAWIYFPLLYALNVTVELVLECAIIALKNGHFSSFWKGLKHFIDNFSFIQKNRNPVSWSTIKKFDTHFPFTIQGVFRRLLFKIQ